MLSDDSDSVPLRVELLAFSVAGVLLLRCVDIMGPPFRRLDEGDRSANFDLYQREIHIRRGTYQFVVRFVLALTVLLIAFVLAGFWRTP